MPVRDREALGFKSQAPVPRPDGGRPVVDAAGRERSIGSTCYREVSTWSVTWRATPRFHAKFASRAQTRRRRAIHLSDAVIQFESAIRDIAYRSGSKAEVRLPCFPPMCVSAPSTTAKKTANVTDTGGQRRIILESGRAGSICSGPVCTPTDGRPAVFKTVYGRP